MPTYSPQYGLGGAEQALMGTYEMAQGNLNPYTATGAGAAGIQSALSGASGQAAQADAFQNYQESPYVDQARQNAERGIMRNAAAMGGIGSGNTMDQLYQNAAGMFMNDFNNQFSRLGQVADRGYNAASNLSGIGANLGSQGAGYRYQTGRDMSNNIGQTTSALANLINQQGSGISDMVGNYTTNVNALMQASAQGDAQAKEQLAMLLSNLAVGQGSQLGSIPAANLATTNRLGQTGQLASGIGALLEALNTGGANA